MSLAQRRRSTATAGEPARPAPRFPPPGLDDQDDRGGRRGRLRAVARVPCDVRRRPGLGYAPVGPGLCSSWRPGSAWRSFPLAVYRWVWRNRRLDQLARLLSRKHPAARRPVAGHHRTGPQRQRAGPLAGALRGGHSPGGRRRAAARLSRRGAQSPAPPLGLAGRRPAGRLRLAFWRSAPTRPRTPGSGCSPPGEARLATRSPPSSPCPPSSSSRTASRSPSRPGSARQAVWRPREGVAQLGEQHPISARSGTAATSSICRRRSIPAGSRSSIGDCGPAASGSSRPCVPS